MSEGAERPLIEGKWAILEHATNYRFVLLVLAFALAADVALVLMGESSLMELSWVQVSENAGKVLAFLVAFGLLMSIGGVVLNDFVLMVARLIVIEFQAWINALPHEGTPDPHRYVSERQAWDKLIESPEEPMRARVYSQKEQRARELEHWHLMVGISLVAAALAVAAWNTPGTIVAILAAWSSWSAWGLVLMASIPWLYQLWNGTPGNYYLYWPELAQELQRKQMGALVRMSNNGYP